MIRELTAAHIDGPVLFPCPTPCGGVCQSRPEYPSDDTPNPVLTLYTSGCRVLNMHSVASFDIPYRLIAIAAAK